MEAVQASHQQVYTVDVHRRRFGDLWHSVRCKARRRFLHPHRLQSFRQRLLIRLCNHLDFLNWSQSVRGNHIIHLPTTDFFICKGTKRKESVTANSREGTTHTSSVHQFTTAHKVVQLRGNGPAVTLSTAWHHRSGHQHSNSGERDDATLLMPQTRTQTIHTHAQYKGSQTPGAIRVIPA